MKNKKIDFQLSLTIKWSVIRFKNVKSIKEEGTYTKKEESNQTEQNIKPLWVSNNHKATNKHAITGKQHFSFANICVPVINKHKSFIPILFGAVEKFFFYFHKMKILQK